MAKKSKIADGYYEVLEVELKNRGALYTRVQGFVLFVLGIVGLKFLLPYVGINITVEAIRFAVFIGFIAAGILGSVSILFKGLGRLLSGKVED